MFLPELDFPRPVNFVCEDCLESSDLMGKIPIRKSSSQSILKDLAVIDVIVFEKSLR